MLDSFLWENSVLSLAEGRDTNVFRSRGKPQVENVVIELIVG